MQLQKDFFPCLFHMRLKINLQHRTLFLISESYVDQMIIFSLKKNENESLYRANKSFSNRRFEVFFFFERTTAFTKYWTAYYIGANLENRMVD